MPSAHGYQIASGNRGAVFALSGNAERNRRQTFKAWEVELRKDSPYVCVRGPVLDHHESLASIVNAAHDVAQDFLDIVAVQERVALLLLEPHDNIVWRTGTHGIKVQLTSSITFSARLNIEATVTTADGVVLPNPRDMPRQHYFAYRYFRYSQAAQNLFDSYRNMFLAMESLLDKVEPKQSGERETDWLERALRTAVKLRRLSLTAFAKAGSNDEVKDFLSVHYTAVRCAAFHSKSSSSPALLPGRSGDRAIVLHQLLAVQELVESLLKSEFSVSLPTSGLFPSAFGGFLAELAPVTGLYISVSDCPTVEQVMSNEENLPEGEDLPVRFDGLNGDLTDEWLFVSENKPEKLGISKIGSLRLVTQPNNHKYRGVIAGKMNRTLMRTEFELEGISKLVVRIRCVFRNLESPRRGFSH